MELSKPLYIFVSFDNNQNQNTMKQTKKSKRAMLAAVGKANREVYIEQNPHGFASVHKVHKSKKAYNRKREKTFHHE